MKLYWLSILLPFTQCFALFGQTIHLPVKWQNEVVFHRNEFGSDETRIYTTPDGGIISAVSSSSFIIIDGVKLEEEGSFFVVLKNNSKGELEWYHKFTPYNQEKYQFASFSLELEVDADGYIYGYLFGKVSIDNQQSVGVNDSNTIICLNSLGELQWSMPANTLGFLKNRNDPYQIAYKSTLGIWLLSYSNGGAWLYGLLKSNSSIDLFTDSIQPIRTCYDEVDNRHYFITEGSWRFPVVVNGTTYIPENGVNFMVIFSSKPGEELNFLGYLEQERLLGLRLLAHEGSICLLHPPEIRSNTMTGHLKLAQAELL